jgi:predicted TIM-barrel fold metal-dependent hydrolase
MLGPVLEGLEPQHTLCFSSDYPHWDFDDPRRTLERLPAEWRDAVAHRNAARFFGLEAAVPA